MAAIENDMNLAYLFTSLQGRVNRAKWWAGQVLLFVVYCAAALLANQTALSSEISTLVWILLYLPAYPLAVKRFQDRNKPGVTSLYGYVPSIVAAWLLGFGPVETAPKVVEVPIGDFYVSFYWNTNALGLICLSVLVAVALWFLIELGMLRGTPGPNRFGADPLR